MSSLGRHIRTFLCGACSGATQGSLGVGGGILMVNGLTRFNGMRQVDAVGTGLPTQILTNTIGGITFASAGLADPLAAVTMGSASILGAMAGVRLGNRIDEETSRGIMGAFMVGLSPLLAIGTMLQQEDDGKFDGLDSELRMGDDDDRALHRSSKDCDTTGNIETQREPLKENWTLQWYPRRVWQEACSRGPLAVFQLLGLGVLVGVISGTLGVGATPVMISYLALNQGPNKVDEYKACVGTALVAVTPNVTTGSISHAMMGSMQLRMVPILGAGTALGALCGSSIALYLPNALMQQIFAAFCAVSGFGLVRKAPLVKRLLK